MFVINSEKGLVKCSGTCSIIVELTEKLKVDWTQTEYILALLQRENRHEI